MIDHVAQGSQVTVQLYAFHSALHGRRKHEHTARAAILLGAPMTTSPSEGRVDSNQICVMQSIVHEAGVSEHVACTLCCGFGCVASTMLRGTHCW